MVQNILHFEPSLDALSSRSDARSSIKILSLFDQDSYTEEYVEATVTQTRTIFRAYFVVANGGASAAAECKGVSTLIPKPSTLNPQPSTLNPKP